MSTTANQKESVMTNETMMITALENINYAAMRENTLSTPEELRSIIRKMESEANIALRKLERRLPL
jgi:hypothetical protein